MIDQALHQQTAFYKTYLKNSLRDGLEKALHSHIDQGLKSTKVNLSYPRVEVDYPCVIVRFYEQKLQNAGVGHYEQFASDDGEIHLWKHYQYTGDIEYAIHTLESAERDVLSDAVMEIVTMGELQNYTMHFLNSIYPSADSYPATVAAGTHYIDIDTDTLRGFGENEVPPKWDPEDQLIYQTSYRSALFGEFYSRVGPQRPTIEHVPIYPWVQDMEDMPQGNPNDPAPWR